jgi:hypothetical protein
MQACPALWELPWSIVSPTEDGASLVYGWAATEVVDRSDTVAIAQLANHLNTVFEVGDEGQTTAAAVGALESWAMTKKGIDIARKHLAGEALRMFERQTEWIKAP